MDQIVMGRTLLLTFLFLAHAMVIRSQQVGDTIVLGSIGEVLSMAQDGNMDRLVYEYQKEMARKEHQLSRSYLLPTVTGSFSAQNNLNLATTPIPGDLLGQPGELVNVQFGQDYNYNAGISVSQTVLDWQKIIQARSMKVGREIADLQADLFEEKLIEQVALYYYTALIAQRALEISEKDFELADSIRILTKLRFDEGLVDKASLNRAAINLNNIEQNLYSNQTVLEQSLNQLKVLLGISYGAELKLEEEYLYGDQVFPVLMELEKDRNITLLERQLEQSRLKVKEQRSNFYPKLTFNGYFGQQQFQNDFTFSLDGEAWTDYSYIGLNLSVPLFTGLANSNRTKVSKLEHAIARKNLESETHKSQLRDDLLMKEYDLSLYTATSAYTNFELYGDNLELALQQYQQGVTSLDSYIQVFEDYLRAENNYLSALSNIYNHYATILSRKKEHEQ